MFLVNSESVLLLVFVIGPNIKYVEEGVRGFFFFGGGVMKYFRHILMGNEKLFKIFDGPQNIFLC